MSFDQIKSQISPSQSHLLQLYDSLSPDSQSSLLNQISKLDIPKIDKIFKTALEADGSSSEQSKLEPPPAELYYSLENGSSDAKRWKSKGLELVSQSKLAVLLLAGGQGTRLGSSAPKGCYDIGLPSHKSLFKLQAERIKKLEQLAGGGGKLVWYVMTSGPTRKATTDYFEEQGWFGMRKEDVVFFEQGTLPCFTPEGKIFLETPSTLTSAPDGNGGIYAALSSPNSINPSAPGPSVLQDMRSRGITHVHAYCVDNCLVKVADPVFVGYCYEKQAECGVKVVKKVDPKESVGIVALKGGKWGVVEYSEIPKEVSEQKDSQNSNELAYRAANIANHFYSLEFLEKVTSPQIMDQMAYHVARKKIPHVDVSTGKQEKPSKPNGIKLELFIFDVFPFVQPLDKMAVLEVERRDEFSPLKNAPGTGADDPDTSRRDLLQQTQRWIEAAGGKVENGVEVELAPGVSYDGEGLEGVKGKKVVKSGKAETWDEFEKLLG